MRKGMVEEVRRGGDGGRGGGKVLGGDGGRGGGKVLGGRGWWERR